MSCQCCTILALYPGVAPPQPKAATRPLLAHVTVLFEVRCCTKPFLPALLPPRPGRNAPTIRPGPPWPKGAASNHNIGFGVALSLEGRALVRVASCPVVAKLLANRKGTRGAGRVAAAVLRPECSPGIPFNLNLMC